MSPTNTQFDHKTWWCLKNIKTKLLKNPGRNTVIITLHILSTEPAIPRFHEQEDIIKTLQRDGILRAYQIPQTGAVFFVGVVDYSITVLQPQFDNMYQLYQENLSVNKRFPDLARINSFSDEIKKKIKHTIVVISEKYELENLTNNNADLSELLNIPIEDLITSGLSKADLQSILIILGKEADFTPYFREKSIEIAFGPSSPAETVINFLNGVKASLILPAETNTGSANISVVSDAQRTSEWDSNLKFDNIAIKFLNGHEVIIKTKDRTKQTTYEEMGFLDKKTKLPDVQWEFLKRLSEHKGLLF